VEKAMGKGVGLSDEQRAILAEAGYGWEQLHEVEAAAIAAGNMVVTELDDSRLLAFLQLANLLYRGGEPLISDADYDFIYLAELRRRQPEHPYLHSVEPEALVMAKTVELPIRMLSTEKAYDFAAVAAWAKRIEKAAEEIGKNFTDLTFRAMPKLDGFAAYDDGVVLYTRGDGRRGTDISRVFDRGLQVAGGGSRGLGAGEIVVSRSYFRENLAGLFDNSRNFQASLIKEKELEPPALAAIASGEAVFFPFALLPDWRGLWAELAGNFQAIVSHLWQSIDYDIDGIVMEIEDDELRRHLGATRHHHRWQLAYKKNTETAEVRVLRVVPQTSRSGRVNPVAEVEPTRLSGALIQRATAHHYRMVVANGIGPGALIRLSRSGEVIPKIEEVLQPVATEVPEHCPSCGSSLVWEGDYLLCVDSMHCPAQITRAIEHFFKILGNIDGFGPAAVEKLYLGGKASLPVIYAMGEGDFQHLGFGPKQAENMVAQLARSRALAIEDWRFLAAFGIYRLGMGNCEKLLAAYPLQRVFSLSREEIMAVRGFSDKTAEELIAGLDANRQLFDQLYGLGFNLLATPLEEDAAIIAGGILAGKLIVFTGTMASGSRDEMKKQAKGLGAKIGESITGNTDLLVCGDKVGPAKLAKAEKLGVRILGEEEYLALLQAAVQGGVISGPA
jgi:DNA ligase (NAD+)